MLTPEALMQQRTVVVTPLYLKLCLKIPGVLRVRLYLCFNLSHQNPPAICLSEEKGCLSPAASATLYPTRLTWLTLSGVEYSAATLESYRPSLCFPLDRILSAITPLQQSLHSSITLTPVCTRGILRHEAAHRDRLRVFCPAPAYSLGSVRSSHPYSQGGTHAHPGPMLLDGERLLYHPVSPLLSASSVCQVRRKTPRHSRSDKAISVVLVVLLVERRTSGSPPESSQQPGRAKHNSALHCRYEVRSAAAVRCSSQSLRGLHYESTASLCTAPWHCNPVILQREPPTSDSLYTCPGSPRSRSSILTSFHLRRRALRTSPTRHLGLESALRLPPNWELLFPAFEAEKRRSDKVDTATSVKCNIATKRKALNWRAVLSSHCVYLWDFSGFFEMFASYQEEPGSIAGGVTRVIIVPDDAAGRLIFSVISCFPRPCIPTLFHTHLFTLVGSQDLHKGDTSDDWHITEVLNVTSTPLGNKNCVRPLSGLKLTRCTQPVRVAHRASICLQRIIVNLLTLVGTGLDLKKGVGRGQKRHLPRRHVSRDDTPVVGRVHLLSEERTAVLRSPAILQSLAWLVRVRKSRRSSSMVVRGGRPESPRCVCVSITTSTTQLKPNGSSYGHFGAVHSASQTP
ncbi:hypothetical protein PR048_019229 [Dryococelus australis]|uniref:Uncharacterized protein n=1 Tax=Dryococelus australis TaxID=614101 RepID=A0ABQ9H378_9NEOP|nr:hypothetical protein PR048_019229 [Dryococelus australis]